MEKINKYDSLKENYLTQIDNKDWNVLGRIKNASKHSCNCSSVSMWCLYLGIEYISVLPDGVTDSIPHDHLYKIVKSQVKAGNEVTIETEKELVIFSLENLPRKKYFWEDNEVIEQILVKVDDSNIEKAIYVDWEVNDKFYRPPIKEKYGLNIRPRNSGWFLYEYLKKQTCLEGNYVQTSNKKAVEDVILNKRVPVIISGNFYKFGHFVVVAGFDKDNWIIFDPYYNKLDKSKPRWQPGKEVLYPKNKFELRSFFYVA